MWLFGYQYAFFSPSKVQQSQHPNQPDNSQRNQIKNGPIRCQKRQFYKNSQVFLDQQTEFCIQSRSLFFHKYECQQYNLCTNQPKSSSNEQKKPDPDTQTDIFFNQLKSNKTQNHYQNQNNSNHCQTQHISNPTNQHTQISRIKSKYPKINS